MNYPEQLQYISDLAKGLFSEVNNVTAIVPIADSVDISVAGASSDIIAAAAGHVYFIKSITVTEFNAIGGLPKVQAYNITPAVRTLCSPNLNAQGFWETWNLFCSRLAYSQGTGSGGSFSVVYFGFDLTYT